MPKTKFQRIIFTAMMVFCMVFCMTCYTIALKLGGLSYQVFCLAIKEMWVEYFVVFLLIFFVITKAAQKSTARILTPGADKPIFVTIAIQCFTVCLIVPLITLFATFFSITVSRRIGWYSGLSWLFCVFLWHCVCRFSL